MKRSNRKMIIILSVIVAFLIVGAIIAKQKGWIGRGNAEQVTTDEVKKRTVIETVSASGKIFPETEITISPDVSGEVIALKIEEGDSVQEGDLIVKIKPDVYESIVERAEAALNQTKANLLNSKARLAQAEAQFENAEQSYNRNKKLFEQKVISESDFEAAEATFKSAQGELEAARESVKAAQFSVKSAEATLKEARDNLVKTTIYAPMSGTISKLNVEKGERVVGTSQMPGTEMLTIADLNNMEVQVDVSENDILRVNVEDTAEIEVDAYLERKFYGVVRHIANSANETQLTSEQVTNFTVKITILKSSYDDLLNKTSTPFKPGMSASVEIFTDRAENSLAVPIQSVTIREEETETATEEVQEEIVFAVDGEKVNAVTVKTGIQDDRYIQIKEGLSEGQEIVTGPYRAISRVLKDGSYVEVVEEKAGE